MTNRAGATYSQCHSTSLSKGNHDLKFDMHLANLGFVYFHYYYVFINNSENDLGLLKFYRNAIIFCILI